MPQSAAVLITAPRPGTPEPPRTCPHPGCTFTRAPRATASGSPSIPRGQPCPQSPSPHSARDSLDAECLRIQEAGAREPAALRPARPRGRPPLVCRPAGGPAAPPGRCLTCDVQLLIRDLGLQVDTAPLLRVVHPTEAGHVDHTLLVHVHVTGCEARKHSVRLRAAWSHPRLCVLVA